MVTSGWVLSNHLRVVGFYKVDLFPVVSVCALFGLTLNFNIS